jgi:hypothetical protein
LGFKFDHNHFGKSRGWQQVEENGFGKMVKLEVERIVMGFGAD